MRGALGVAQWLAVEGAATRAAPLVQADLFEEMGVETDKDVGVSYDELRALVQPPAKHPPAKRARQ